MAIKEQPADTAELHQFHNDSKNYFYRIHEIMREAANKGIWIELIRKEETKPELKPTECTYLTQYAMVNFKDPHPTSTGHLVLVGKRLPKA